ncbi:MAG: polysaccharide biosynthesis protein [Spirochaetaceae bacterium]|nr:polysaccharide biosynthesis protein [Spirochaetaceae bacterium]
MKSETTAHKGFAVLSIAGILNKLLSVIYIPVLFQIIGELGYGIYSAGYKIYAFIYILTNAGFPIGIAKLEAEFLARKNYRDARRSFRIVLWLLAIYGFVMSVLTAVFARSITQAIHNDNSYLVILALSPTIFFSAISSSFRGFFNGRNDMKPTAVSQIIEQFINVFLSLAFAAILKPFGLVYACAGATVGTTIGSLGSALYLWRQYRKKSPDFGGGAPADIVPLSNRQIINRFLSYAVPIAINSVIIFGTDLVDLANTSSRLVAAGLSAEAATIQFGVLSKYSSILSVPIAVTSALYVAMMPSFSAAIELHDNDRLKASIGEAFRLSLMISIPSAIGLSILSKPVFSLFFPSAIDGWKLMAFGSIVVVFYSIVQIQAGILQALNKTKYSTISLLVGIGAKILVNYYLIAVPSINIMGAVIGTIVYYIVALLLNLVFLHRFQPVKTGIMQHVWHPLAGSIVMGVVVYAVYKGFAYLLGLIVGAFLSNALSTAISVIVGVVVYAAFIIKTNAISVEEIGELPYGKKIIVMLKKIHLIA